jgi:hypothetical protein
MRRTPAAGERLFVDYADGSVPVVIDRLTAKYAWRKSSSRFWGASSFTFAGASWT